MTASSPSVHVTLRIPGAWSHPGELVERLPAGYRLTPETLRLPDGADLEFIPMPPDDQFPEIFASSCRQPATEGELATVGRYTVNIGLKGPGGSLAAAHAMMRGAAAIVQAGGAGVFIDNSALAHGGGHWLAMTDDGGPDALSYAFVSIVSSADELWTMGLHVLGFPDLVMRRADIGPDGEEIIEVIRYVCRGDRPITDGDLLGDEHGPRFQAAATPSDERPAGSPIHNPFGRLKLTSLRDIAEGN
jgi:hypothetical protein